MKWIINYLSLAAVPYRYKSAPYVIGDPKAQLDSTMESLKSKGVVGIYHALFAESDPYANVLNWNQAVLKADSNELETIYRYYQQIAGGQ